MCSNVDENFQYKRKITENGGGIPTKMFISQQPKAIESTNWYQKIAMTIFYNHVLRYINKLNSLLLQYLRNFKI